MEKFVAIMEQLMEFAEVNKPNKVLDEIIKLTHYDAYLLDAEKEDAEERINNLMELQEIAASYTDMQDFLNSMVLNAQKIEEDGENFDGVNMMTMHASKGLEFPVVIMIGANEGVIPHFKSIVEGDVSEERRLFYVAMTRAEKFLFITRPKMMMRQGAPAFCQQSRFIAEVDPKYIKRT